MQIGRRSGAVGSKRRLSNWGPAAGGTFRDILHCMQSAQLNPVQRAHVAQVFPESRDDMARFLQANAAVSVREQTEVGESPRYAIFVLAEPEFWIDCCESRHAAESRARALKLTVV